MSKSNGKNGKFHNQSINVAANPSVAQSTGPITTKRRSRSQIKEQILKEDPTREYQSTRYAYYGELFVQNLPLWRLWTARMMLTSDPIINFSLNVRNAALMATQIKITAKSPRVKAWLAKQWHTLWNYNRPKLLSAKKWGFAPLQCVFKIDKSTGLIDIKELKDFAPEDARALQCKNKLCGMRVKGDPIFFPQALWLKFGGEFGSPYGTAVTRRQYPAWYEKWMDHGAKRLLQLRMIKDSYIGDIFWYPPHINATLPDGTSMPWRDLMREIGENRLSGGALTLPRLLDSNGKELTGYQPPQPIPGATEIFNWVDSCDDNILKGADIPVEVVQAADTGSGFSGRSIPFLVLLSVCNNEIVEIVQCIVEQVLRPLAWLNWGEDVEFEMEPLNLVQSFAGDIQGSSLAGGSIGGPMQQQQAPPQQIPQPGQGSQATVQFGETDERGEDLIPGGKGDKEHDLSKFDPEQIAAGIKVEMEHTSDPRVALEICVDHLTEDPHYYTKLAKIDKGAKEALQHQEYPSEAQIKAGNYKKEKRYLHGLTVTIENKKGTRRRPEWPKLSADYGYINRTKGRDGDHVDCFIGSYPESEVVFVIDQVNKNGRFDEHKVVFGETTKIDAIELYLANYPAGWRIGPVTAMTIPQFKSWLEDGDTTSRVSKQVSQYAESVDFENKDHLHAPPGGVTIHGVKYKGGEFIPKEVINALSPEDQQKLRAGSIARHIKARPELAEKPQPRAKGTTGPGTNGPATTGTGKRPAPGSQMPEHVKKKLRDLGMVGTFPPHDVKMEDIRFADLSKGKEALKGSWLMSWTNITKSGRKSPQYRYTQEFLDQNADNKFERITAIEPHIEKIKAFLTKAVSTKTLSQKDREAAGIANIIRETGLRPTDNADSVKHGHYGIASLQARHCTIKGDTVHLDFIGKEGVRNRTVVREPANVALLKELLGVVSGKDFLFKNASSNDAGDVLKKISEKVGGPKDIKLKDLRTLKATQLGREVARNYEAPTLTGNEKKDTKMLKRAMLEMSAEVSKVLNNQPMQAFKSYIHPSIFKDWQEKITERMKDVQSR